MCVLAYEPGYFEKGETMMEKWKLEHLRIWNWKIENFESLKNEKTMMEKWKLAGSWQVAPAQLVNLR